MRAVAPLLVIAVLATGCGGSDYEDEASDVCREFNEASFGDQVEVERARELYARLREDLGRLSPPDDLRGVHEVMLGFARAGEQVFATVEDPDAPTIDLGLSVGDWEDDIPAVQRELPACADSLTGTHPEIQVIR